MQHLVSRHADWCLTAQFTHGLPNKILQLGSTLPLKINLRKRKLGARRNTTYSKPAWVLEPIQLMAFLEVGPVARRGFVSRRPSGRGGEMPQKDLAEFRNSPKIQFRPFCTDFGPFRTNLDQIWTILEQFWAIFECFGPILADSGPFWRIKGTNPWHNSERHA